MIDIKKVSRLFANSNKNKQLILPEYNAVADSDWILTKSKLPWLPLDIKIPREEIEKEILAIRDYLVDHRTDYNEHSGWSSFTIHGKAEDATREDEYYNDNRPHNWTATALKLMPKTVEYFQTQWPCPHYARLRVMALAPNSMISVHQDGVDPNELGPVNIAITQPEDCNFYMENFGIVPFQLGSSIMLNVTNRHVVINDSNETRYHLIVHHTRTTKPLDNLVKLSYNKLYAG
jgi:Aspartyl/Asparaginyl beta-hydroxylase